MFSTVKAQFDLYISILCTTCAERCAETVSYTHLDVYKRQIVSNAVRHSPIKSNVYVTLSTKELVIKNAVSYTHLNLEALYICRNVITVYPDCKSIIDVARQKLMNDPTFKHLSEDCQEYYFDFEAYASHLQEMCIRDSAKIWYSTSVLKQEKLNNS